MRKSIHYLLAGILMLGTLAGCAGENAHEPSPESTPAEATTLSKDGKSQKIVITIDHGYKPSHIKAKAGIPLELEFFRNEQIPSCAKDVEIPAVKQKFSLANQGTQIVSIPPQPKGHLEIRCQMDMMHGLIDIE